MTGTGTVAGAVAVSVAGAVAGYERGLALYEQEGAFKDLT